MSKLPLTKAQVKAIMPKMKALNEWYVLMEDILPKYKIDTPLRMVMFLAQTAHESGQYRIMAENLNYSAKRLNEVFGKYFNRAGRSTKGYARNPEKLANLVYGNRMGNGGPETGDGYQYRGRGIIQLTGKNNYSEFAKDMGMSLDEAVEYLGTKRGALESAAWFWKKRGLNSAADAGDIRRATKLINGGYNGLSDRSTYYNRGLKFIGDTKPTTKVNTSTNIGMGDRGQAVKDVQKALGITSDGVFGPQTKRAVKHFQAKNGLVADGVVGPKTAAKLFA